MIGAVPTRLPADLSLDCGSDAEQSAAAGGLPEVEVPPGMSFLKVPAPPAQPQLGEISQHELDLFTPPEPLPAVTSMPDIAGIPLPTRELLADRSALS